LPICEIYVESQNEEIGKPSYTSFYIRIPLGKAHLKAEEILQVSPHNQPLQGNVETTAEVQSPTPPTEEAIEISEHIPSKERKMVLLVDDNEEILQYLYQQLNKNYQVVLTRD